MILGLGIGVIRPILIRPDAAPPPDPDPISCLTNYWRLGEATGNRVDTIGGLDMAPTGTPTNGPGILGDGLVCDGAPDRLTRDGDTPTLVDTSFSISAWVRWDDLAGQASFVISRQNSTDIGWGLWRSSGANIKAIFTAGGGGHSAAGPDLVEGQLYFIVVRFDLASTVITIDIFSEEDGHHRNAVETLAGPIVASSPNAALVIGGGIFAFATSHIGMIDEVGLYDCRITDEQVDALWNNGNGAYPWGIGGGGGGGGYPAGALLDESGDPLLDESGDFLMEDI